MFAGEDLVGLEFGGGFGGLHFVVFAVDGGGLGEVVSKHAGGAGNHDLEGAQVVAQTGDFGPEWVMTFVLLWSLVCAVGLDCRVDCVSSQ